MKKLLLIIDPQVDFITGSLAVKNAEECMTRLTNLIKESGMTFDDIIVTLDSHQSGHVSFRSSWLVKSWENDEPVTKITPEMIGNCIKPRYSDFNLEDISAYIKRQEGSCLNLWPDHCVIGTPGHAIYPDLFNALEDWAKKNQKSWKMILKGNRTDREMYSAISCDGEENIGLGYTPVISGELLKEYDKIYIAGIAMDFCVAETVKDLVKKFESEIQDRLVFIDDCMPLIVEGNESTEIYRDSLEKHGAIMINADSYHTTLLDYLSGNH
jgi:nicotinamidase-related amidase